MRWRYKIPKKREGKWVKDIGSATLVSRAKGRISGYTGAYR